MIRAGDCLDVRVSSLGLGGVVGSRLGVYLLGSRCTRSVSRLTLGELLPKCISCQDSLSSPGSTCPDAEDTGDLLRSVPKPCEYCSTLGWCCRVATPSPNVDSLEPIATPTYPLYSLDSRAGAPLSNRELTPSTMASSVSRRFLWRVPSSPSGV